MVETGRYWTVRWWAGPLWPTIPGFETPWYHRATAMALLVGRIPLDDQVAPSDKDEMPRQESFPKETDSPPELWTTVPTPFELGMIKFEESTEGRKKTERHEKSAV